MKPAPNINTSPGSARLIALWNSGTNVIETKLATKTSPVLDWLLRKYPDTAKNRAKIHCLARFFAVSGYFRSNQSNTGLVLVANLVSITFVPEFHRAISLAEPGEVFMFGAGFIFTTLF